MSMSVDGLISGMDTTSLITQLLQAEAGPQRALQARLTATKDTASAYRTVNTAIAAVRAAADSLLKPSSWTATKAESSSTNVTVSSSSSAAAGSLTFTVDRLASAHAIFRTDPTWTETSSATGVASLDVYAADGTTKKGTITVGGTQSVADVVAAINASSYGLTAAAVKNDAGTYTVQVAAKQTGAANVFSFQGAGTFSTSATGADAKLTIGSESTYSVTSDTNTFTSVLPGVTIAATKADTTTPVTVSVSSDPDAVAAQVQKLVDAVNAAVGTVRKYTNNAKGSREALAGDFSIGQLTGQLFDAVTFAVGSDGSPATMGFTLNKDVKDLKVVFDKSTFTAALKADPALAQRVVGGTAAGPGSLPGPEDDVEASGIAGRLLTISQAASDSTTGSLVKLAANQDAKLRDIQDRIDAWDLRLAKRRESLSRQFSVMETALSSLRNQSTWLAGQINSLPSYG